MFNLKPHFRGGPFFFFYRQTVHFHVLSYPAAADTTRHAEMSGLKDYMMQNYNNLINSDVICCQKKETIAFTSGISNASFRSFPVQKWNF